MNKFTRNILTISLVIAASAAAAAVMAGLTPQSSWLAFAGWLIFFASLQLPWLVVPPRAQNSCTAWLARFRKG